MGFIIKVQVIQRSNKNRQFYIICPAALGEEALEMEKGEFIEWMVQDKQHLMIKRRNEKKGETRGTTDAK